MSFSTNEPMPGAYDNPRYAPQPPQQLELTPEEVSVIRECSREGIYQRAIPMGVMFALGGLLGAKAGPLNNAKFGVKPAVIGLGVIGYAIGRMSYSKVCFERAIQVPTGNLRKLFPNAVRNNEFLEPSQNFYSSSVDTSKSQDQSFLKRSSSTDIDLPSMSNLDTNPSDYYAPRDYGAEENKEVTKSYTSYDDLRRQNRQEYSNKMFETDTQRSPPSYQRAQEPRRFSQDPQNFEGNIGRRTKYGDLME